MENNKAEYKISFYDKFKCTADKCNLTCCSGWDIAVDDKTFEKWHECSKNYCSSCFSDDDSRIINKETEEDCPFLDTDKLCHIVKDSGDDYLSETCRTFPRIINNYNDRREVSLSCACPEVVEIISRTVDINLEDEGLSNAGNNFEIREILIDIIKNSDFPLGYRLILCYSMMNNLLDADNKKSEVAVKERFKDKDYLKELADYYKSIKPDIYDSLYELNSLFVDITENYRHVKLLRSMLEDVCSYAENIDIDSIVDSYDDFIKFYEQYDELNEKSIITKIYNIFMDSDYTEIAVNFEMIILEYILGRYALFLKYCLKKDNKICAADVKESIAVLSRIISSNSDAVREFIADGFDCEMLDIGYICFIALM